MTSPSGNGDTGTRTLRRHGPWQFTELVTGKRRSIHIDHDHWQTSVQYWTDESGAPERMTIERYTLTPDQQKKLSAAIPQPESMDRTDTVLGETCHWLNMTPGITDAGNGACLSADNIALKEAFWSRVRHTEWTAIRIARRPITIDEIKPPAELLAPKTWGAD